MIKLAFLFRRGQANRSNTVEEDDQSVIFRSYLMFLFDYQSAESTENSAAQFFNFILIKYAVWKYVHHL